LFIREIFFKGKRIGLYPFPPVALAPSPRQYRMIDVLILHGFLKENHRNICNVRAVFAFLDIINSRLEKTDWEYSKPTFLILGLI